MVRKTGSVHIDPTPVVTRRVDLTAVHPRYLWAHSKSDGSSGFFVYHNRNVQQLPTSQTAISRVQSDIKDISPLPNTVADSLNLLAPLVSNTKQAVGNNTPVTAIVQSTWKHPIISTNDMLGFISSEPWSKQSAH
jgi:hypothetical protein